MHSVGVSPKPRSVQVQDTTDVSTFQTFMAKRCETLPLRVLLAYAHTHVGFNQITCSAASLRRRRSYSSRRGLTGNCYRALSRSLSKQVNDFARRITEAQLLERSGYRVTSEKRVCYRDADTVERAVLACKLVGEDAMHGACLVLYEKNPSRDFWKTSMLTWLEQVHSKCSGCFNHY